MLNFDRHPVISGLSEEQIQRMINETSYDQNCNFSEIQFPDMNNQMPTTSKNQQQHRFVEIDSINDTNNQLIPKNTVKRDRWAINMFTYWYKQRFNADVQVQNLTDEQLIDNVSRFIHETRKDGGGCYSPTSLVSIISGIQHHINLDGNRSVDFFKEHKFHLITRSLDAAMKIATRNGVGLQRKHAEIISEEEEKKMWTSVFGDESPSQLIKTLFYLNGIHFALRGGSEHTELTIDQFEATERNGKRCLIYSEKFSKTFSGGLRDMRKSPKKVVHFENVSSDGRKSHIDLFTKFISVRPKRTTRFYLQPLKEPKDGCWFSTRPIGKNSLSKFMKDICSLSGIDGRKTNHSLRATCASRLYQSNVDEQLIMEHTGHQSAIGVRNYKRTNDYLLSNCSAILDSKKICEMASVSTTNASTAMRPNITFNFNNGCNVIINNNN